MDIDDGDTIIIKINLCYFRDYRSGAITDPRILKALLTILTNQFHNLKIYLIESDATATFVDLLFEWLDINQVASKFGAKPINLSNQPFIIKKFSTAKIFKNQRIPKLLEDSHFFISLAKMKTHSLTGVTGILKNQFGCIVEKRKVKYHPFLDEVIADVNLAFKPDLSIIDGNIAMEGIAGPVWGSPRMERIFLAGEDPVAVDAFMAKLMGFNPKKIRHIKLAGALKIGNVNYKTESDYINLIQKFQFNKFDQLFMNTVNFFKNYF